MGALALLASLAFPGTALAAAGEPGEGARLKDRRAFAHWAHPVQVTAVRGRPSQGSRRVAWTHYRTEDGYPEVYPVLSSVQRKGASWVRIRVPGRPNGRTGWVRGWALVPYTASRPDWWWSAGDCAPRSTTRAGGCGGPRSV